MNFIEEIDKIMANMRFYKDGIKMNDTSGYEIVHYATNYLKRIMDNTFVGISVSCETMKYYDYEDNNKIKNSRYIVIMCSLYDNNYTMYWHYYHHTKLYDFCNGEDIRNIVKQAKIDIDKMLNEYITHFNHKY